MTIDTTIVAILVTIIIAIISCAAWVGALYQKVKTNKEYINNIRSEFKSYQIDNKGDHTLIFTKLDEIIRNGKRG